jgi:hypothetical protein
VQTEMQKSLVRLACVVLAGICIAVGAASARDDAREGHVMISGPGNNRINGGPGFDMAVFSGSRWSYVIFRIEDQVVIVGPDGEDRLTNVEVLHFDDMTLNLAASLSRRMSNGLLENIPEWRVTR